MSPTPIKSVASSKPSADKKPSRLQKLNARAVRLQAAYEAIASELEGYAAAMPANERDGKTGISLLNAATESRAAAAAAAEVPKRLFRLHELKWEVPSKKSSSGIKAGDTVSLRDRRVERFTKNGAYTMAQVARLEVVSVHADQAKVRIAGTKELLGLVPTSWLTTKNTAAAA
jgi:hypothetical protein